MRLIYLSVLNLILYACNHGPSVKDEMQPNIILLLSDDHGAEDLAFLGNKDVATPFMDQLASEGLVFTNAFATASVCAPSRSSLYTGLYPHKNGCHQNHGDIYENIKTLPQYLSEVGYRVALAGKVHVGPEQAFPFEYIDRQNIPDFLQSAGSQPICLVVAYNQPHEPYFNKKSGVPFRNIQAKAWLPDTPETRKLTAAYYDNVENLDHEIGSTLYWLEKYGYTDNSIIMYTSDHGPGLPFAKWTLYEKAVHVPLIIKWKGKIEAGRRIDDPVSLLDLLPSFMHWAGAEPLPALDGKSLLPLIEGKEMIPDRSLFAAYTNLGVQDANYYPIRSTKNQQYKLLVNFNSTEAFTIRMTERADERSAICAWRALESWKNPGDRADFAAERYQFFRFRPEIELYNLEEDPFEINNIAGDPQLQMKIKELLGELKKWMEDQGDALSEKI